MFKLFKDLTKLTNINKLNKVIKLYIGLTESNRLPSKIRKNKELTKIKFIFQKFVLPKLNSSKSQIKFSFCR